MRKHYDFSKARRNPHAPWRKYMNLDNLLTGKRPLQKEKPMSIPWTAERLARFRATMKRKRAAGERGPWDSRRPRNAAPSPSASTTDMTTIMLGAIQPILVRKLQRDRSVRQLVKALGRLGLYVDFHVSASLRKGRGG